MSAIQQLINSILQGHQALIRFFIPSRQYSYRTMGSLNLSLRSCRFHSLLSSMWQIMDMLVGLYFTIFFLDVFLLLYSWHEFPYYQHCKMLKQFKQWTCTNVRRQCPLSLMESLSEFVTSHGEGKILLHRHLTSSDLTN